MPKYLITSYSQLIDRMRSNGHVFDVGQISPLVLSHAYAAVHDGLIKVSIDSWPFRGFAGKESRTVFELARQPSIPSKS